MKINKKYFKLVVMIFSVFLLTGCTTYMEDADNNQLKDPATGQRLVSNILCQPTKEEVIELYTEAEKDLTELPECQYFSITGNEYNGIWDTLFVRPLAFIIINIGKIFNNYGIAIILSTLLIRLLMYPLTQKQAMQSENIKKAQPEIKKLDKKYQNRTDQEAMMQKSQETMQIYKKYNINPLSGCLFAFIQIPLFFAFYEALYRLPVIFEGTFLGINMGMTAATAVLEGKFGYILIVAGVVLVTHFSMKLNAGAMSVEGDQAKAMATMKKVMVGMVGISSCFVSAAIGIYWITNSTFTILQNLYAKRRALIVK